MADPTVSTDSGSQATASPPMGPSVGELSTYRDTGLAPFGQQVPQSPYGPAVDPLAGGLDYGRLLHAFRRCWLPATAIGLAIGLVAATAAWLTLPRGYEAIAWLRVRANTGGFMTGGMVGGEYESYRKTQVQLIKSPFVLTSTMRRPGIAELETFKEIDDPIDWLARKLSIVIPAESEVLQIRLRGERAADVASIVNAVTDAYLKDIVNKEKSDRLERRDTLERKYKENMTEVRQRLETFNSLARSLGTSDSSEVATQRSLLLDHLGTLRARLTQLKGTVAVIDAELAIMDARAKGDLDEAEGLPDDQFEFLLMRDPEVAEIRGRLAALEEAITFQGERSARGRNDPAVRRLIAQRAALIENLERRKEEVRPRLSAELAAGAVGNRTAGYEGPATLRKRRELASIELEEVSKEFDTVAEEVKKLGQANADLEARKRELDHLQSVTDEMGRQLNASEVDLAMPNRVELIEEAGVPRTSDNLFRIMLTGLVGMAGLALGVGALVGLEYWRDRVNAADQLTQRLGIRVIGTVPRIARSAKKPDDGSVAECVDGVRTVISQSGRETPRVLLVTSAVEHEGKTTLSSQLAASLARSGKRTLLVDGDLRHPNVHLAVELDLRQGMPELLRGEIGVDEAIQPTGIEGLFVVTGGTCDYAAITCLSRPEAAAIMKKFRESFDHVIVDAGPVLAFADVLQFGQLSDVAILATMRDVSSIPQVTTAIDRLRSVGIRVLGTVVNGVADSGPRRRYAALGRG